MHAQNYRAKDEAQNLKSKKVVAIKLNIGRISEPTAHQQATSLGQKAIDKQLRLLPKLNRQLNDVRDQADGSQWTMQEQCEQRTTTLLLLKGWRTIFAGLILISKVSISKYNFEQIILTISTTNGWLK